MAWNASHEEGGDCGAERGIFPRGGQSFVIMKFGRRIDGACATARKWQDFPYHGRSHFPAKRHARALALATMMFRSAIPVISVSDSFKAEEYYCKVLGFQRMFAYRPNPEKSDPGYLGLARDGVWLHLDSFKPERAGLQGAFFSVADVDQFHAEYSARGAICQLPPTDQTWGDREMHIRDQDGNVLCFAKLPNEVKV
jgi:uncharacterized glyoxalase superfamily protein PhnB